MAVVLDVISKGAAQSWQLDNRGRRCWPTSSTSASRCEWMLKDLRHGARGSGARNGARLPVTALVEEFYAEIGRMGGERWDTSSLVRRLR